MNAVSEDVKLLVEKELEAANERFPQFHSPHEGWAVIREEAEELRQETDDVLLGLEDGVLGLAGPFSQRILHPGKGIVGKLSGALLLPIHHGYRKFHPRRPIC